MGTIFLDSENSKTYKRHVLILKRTNKLHLRISEKIIASSNVSIYNTWKIIKTHTITVNLKYLHQHGMINLNYMMDIQDYFEYILKKHRESTDKPSVQIYVNKIENKVTFNVIDGIVLSF